MTITWDQSLSVGVSSIDDDHKKLLDIINRVDDRTDKSRAQLVEIFKELRDYTHYHFSREEELMVENNYTLLSQHKAEHTLFISTVEDFTKRATDEQDLNALQAEATSFLSRWLSRHIRWSDLDYVCCVTGEKQIA